MKPDRVLNEPPLQTTGGPILAKIPDPYEYQIVTFWSAPDKGNVEKALARLASDGWRLVTSVQLVGMTGLIFERLKRQEDEGRADG